MLLFLRVKSDFIYKMISALMGQLSDCRTAKLGNTESSLILDYYRNLHTLHSQTVDSTVGHIKHKYTETSLRD